MLPCRCDCPGTLAFSSEARRVNSQLLSWHVKLADAFFLMAALHLLAVAWHFLIKRDGVLYAMLPWNFFRPSWGRNKKKK